MSLQYMPLLQTQLDLYAMPRGMDRFRAYIKTMTDEDTGDLALPLVAMNPMGKDHIPALIEQYIALDAEGIAADAVAGVKVTLSRDHKVSIVVSDDLKGGWTNRWASEFSHRIEGAAITKRGFLVAILWTSEPASANAVREAVLTAIYREEYLQSHPVPKTLAEMLAQEGYATARARCTTPSLDTEDLAYTRSVIEPHLSATARSIVIPCLFGDPAAIALGYLPQGLSDRAGLALARHDAIAQMRR